MRHLSLSVFLRLPAGGVLACATAGIGSAVAQPAAAVEDTPPVVDVAPSEGQLVDRAATYFEAGRYEECVTAFESALKHDGVREPKSREQARTYLAACQLALGHEKSASEQFRLAIQENPQMSPPDGIVFPIPVIDRFFAVRETLLAEITRAQDQRLARAEAARRSAEAREAAERQRILGLESFAERQPVVERHRRSFASMPFGVGQFQNRDPLLGWIFFGAETALGVTAISAAAIELDLHHQAAERARDLEDTDVLNENLQVAHQIFLWSAGALAVTAITGIIEAHASYVPEHESERRRKLPKELRRKKPSAAGLGTQLMASQDGFAIGWGARF